MTYIQDWTTVNACGNQGDWSQSGDMAIKLNENGSVPQIYREGTACIEAQLGSNKSGYQTDTIAVNLTGKALVWWNWITGPVEMSALEYWTNRVYDGANYVDYDWLPEMLIIGTGGWFPGVLWPTPSPESHITNSGTPVVSSIDEIEVRGSNNDGTINIKVAGWDIIGAIGYFGANAQTVTLEQLVLEAITNHYGILTQKGKTFEAQCILRYGGSGTTTVNESNKTLTFRGANEDHPTGFEYISGGTATNITYADMVFNWKYNEAGGVFKLTDSPDIFKFDGCQFNNHPDMKFPVHSGSVDRWHKNCKYNGGKEIDIDTMTFEDGIITNKISGVFYSSTGVRRAKNNLYINNTDAIRFDAGQEITLDGDKFLSNTYDIHFDSPTITAAGSYPETNQDTDVNLNATNKRVAQSGWPNATTGTLSHARFYLKKTGTPTGNLVAKLYDSIPGGPPTTLRATSETIAASAIGTTYALHTFEFKKAFSILGPATYAISIEYEDGDASNYITVGVDNSSPTHVGTGYLYTTSWASQTWDACFYAFRGGLLYINATNGADPSAAKVKITGTNPTPIVVISNPKAFKFTVSPSITGYEWRIYTVTALGSLAGAVEIDGEENATADNQTYSYNYTADQSIAVQIIPQPDEDYEESISYYTLKSADQDISILLQEDINN